MGRRVANCPRPLHAIEADAQAALAAALDAGNFDLSAELLWTWPMLNRPWSASALFAFSVLAQEQDAYGFLPGPGYRAREAQQLSEPQRRAYRLQTSYHANFVMGFLCAAALRPGREPPVWPTGAGRDAESSELLSLLAPRPEAIAWTAAMAKLDAEQQAALTDFLLAVILRRAAASHILDSLRVGLNAAVQLNADGPSVRQTLALLRRTLMLARVTARASTPSHAPSSAGFTQQAQRPSRSRLRVPS